MYDINNLLIGEKLLEFRLKNGLSRGKLSKLTNINQLNLIRWEKNRAKPSMIEYHKLMTFVEQLENKK